MDLVIFSFEELDKILETYNFTSVDWIRIFKRETIPRWFIKKHAHKLAIKNAYIWHTKCQYLLKQHQIDMDILDENIHVFGVQLVYMYQRVSKYFIINHLPDLMLEVKKHHNFDWIERLIWKNLVSPKCLNRDIIEDTLELYIDPKGIKKYNMIKIRESEQK